MKIEKINRLIYLLKKLPGVGPKMAERIAYYILNTDTSEITELVDAINAVKEKITLCKECFAPSENDICSICSDKSRDHSIICIVEKVEDLDAIERMKKYSGLYYILGGVISPVDGIGPENLRINQLIQRVNSDSIKEVIIATNPTTEGEITANYIARMLNKESLKITRIGYGLPVGGSVEYADEITLMRSFESRKELNLKE